MKLRITNNLNGKYKDVYARLIQTASTGSKLIEFEHPSIPHITRTIWMPADPTTKLSGTYQDFELLEGAE